MGREVLQGDETGSEDPFPHAGQHRRQLVLEARLKERVRAGATVQDVLRWEAPVPQGSHFISLLPWTPRLSTLGLERETRQVTLHGITTTTERE